MNEPVIRPEPEGSERQIVLAAVRAVIEQAESRVRTDAWRVSGWTQARAGVTDLASNLSPGRAWVLSNRLPWGGKQYCALTGRGDAK